MASVQHESQISIGLRICIEFDDESQGCEESDLLVPAVHQAAGELPSFWRSLELLQRLLRLDDLIRSSRGVQLTDQLRKVSISSHEYKIEVRESSPSFASVTLKVALASTKAIKQQRQTIIY